MAACCESRGEEAAGFDPVDRAVSFAGHVAVACMDLQGWAPLADAEFDDPLRRCGPVAAAAFLFGLPSGEGGDLGVDALQPHDVPHPQGVQAIKVGRQVIERGTIRPEHPRVGGEDSGIGRAMLPSSGTPPRRRGGPTRLLRQLPHGRNPRVGGEDHEVPQALLVEGGTPPRRRGGRPPGRAADRSGRNTPFGGEDTPSQAAAARRLGTPPRRRGGLGHPHHLIPYRRNTPASAGRTGGGRWRAARRAEHPRVGGEDTGRPVSVNRHAGTPPRRRGGLGPAVMARVRQRNTPASAGRTPA